MSVYSIIGSTDQNATALKRYYDVIYALVMHDIKNRFFGSGLGQIVMVLWPFVHIVVLISIYYFTGRPHPYGDGIVQYSAVSVFPFIMFSYMGRWIVLSAQTNKSFLQYPIIRPIDLLVARTYLEMISNTLVGFLLILLVTVCGNNPMPADTNSAISALIATTFFAVGFGFFNASIAFIVPLWPVVVTLIILLMWISSGVLFVASTLPEAIRTPLSYNPLLQCTEWMRSAYYSDYPTSVLDKTYVLEFSLVMLTAGLVLLGLLKRFY